jgi:hypothetical protein
MNAFNTAFVEMFLILGVVMDDVIHTVEHFNFENFFKSLSPFICIHKNNDIVEITCADKGSMILTVSADWDATQRVESCKFLFTDTFHDEKHEVRIVTKNMPSAIQMVTWLYQRMKISCEATS